MPNVAELTEGQLWQSGGTLLKVSTPSPDSPNPGSTMQVVLEGGRPPGRTTVRYYDALDLQAMTEPSAKILAAYEAAYAR